MYFFLHKNQYKSVMGYFFDIKIQEGCKNWILDKKKVLCCT